MRRCGSGRHRLTRDDTGGQPCTAAEVILSRQPGARMNHSKPTQSRVPHRNVALYASFLGFLIIVSIAFSACSPASNETPAASANASPSASDQTQARRQIEAAAIGIWQA